MEVMAKAVMVLVIIFLAAMVLADMEAMMVYGLTEAPLPDRKALVQTSPFQRFFSHPGLDGASYGCGCAYEVAICVDRATSRSVHPCLSAFEF